MALKKTNVRPVSLEELIVYTSFANTLTSFWNAYLCSNNQQSSPFFVLSKQFDEYQANNINYAAACVSIKSNCVITTLIK